MNPMRPAFRLVPDFILPHLEKSTYGNHLQWEDRRKGSFKISRIHQSSEEWNEHCIQVYKAWSVKKRLWKMDDPKRITKAKHRLITALRRNSEIEMLEKESSFYRFRIIRQNMPDYERESSEDMSSEINMITTENQSVAEIIKTTDDTPFDGICDYADIFEVSKENIDSSLLTNCETLTYPTSYSSALSELYDNTPKTFPMSGIFCEEPYSCETSSTDFSDKCCCDVLLDNYLRNQKCIWHGSQL